MTLKTSVAVGAPTNVHELYRFCRALIGTPDGVEPITSQDDPDQSRSIPRTDTRDRVASRARICMPGS